jgi:hypothetical protein
MGLLLVSGTTRRLVEDVANRLHVLTRVSIGNRNVGSEVRYVDYPSSAAQSLCEERRKIHIMTHETGKPNSSSTTSIQRPAALLVLAILGRVYMYVCAHAKKTMLQEKSSWSLIK